MEKRIRKLLTVVCAVILLCSAIPALAEDAAEAPADETVQETVAEAAEETEEAAEETEEATEEVNESKPTWLQDLVSKFGKTPLEAWISFATLIVLGIVLLAITRTRKLWTTKTIAYGALSVALAFVLSCIRLFRMPNSGSVTPGSMLPIMLFSATFGIGPGLLTGMVYGVLQCLQGGGIMAAGGWAQFALDYLLAFTALGLAGIAKKSEKTWVIILGVIVAAMVRLLCHTLAGILFWNTAPWASFVYNISYIGPDTLICIVLAFAIAKPVMRIMKSQ